MQPVYGMQWHITTEQTDCFDRLRPASVLGIVQEVAGEHSIMLGAGRDDLLKKSLFWAVIRHRVQIARLPRARETILVRTWPMPTTRTAYPRACEAVDEQGNLLFRAVSLWVLMDQNSRAMILPGKSGVTVDGYLCGTEIDPPAGLSLKEGALTCSRSVLFSDLDVNGHMNNCRCLDWAADVLGRDFFAGDSLSEFTVCYFSEGRPGEQLSLSIHGDETGVTVDGLRPEPEMSAGKNRVFSIRLQNR